ncbi:hypothetical protein AA313_de0207573 [Arthrobotrys entomopaga]|nr:hypothetical protein AA313_de0207573 [Arthrobotrys entomopaga]
MVNAVWLFMHWNDIDTYAAKKIVRDLIFQAEAKFLQARYDFIQNATSEYAGLARYIDQFCYLVPGNTLWSVKCPRYNKAYRKKSAPSAK